MQIKLKIHKDGIFEFPLNYNYQFQSAIYALLSASPCYSDFLHDHGYGDPQSFKMFTFGNPQGEYEIIDKKIYFNEYITLEIRSVSEEFCEIIKNCVMSRGSIKLFNYDCDIEEMTIYQKEISSTSLYIKTQSPIVIYTRSDENKTLHFSPRQKEFYSLADSNFQNKYKAYSGHESLTNIVLLPVSNFKKVVTSYKGTWITAYHGNFELHGSSLSIQFLYDTGLGMKNPQGFGMFDIL